MCNDIGEASYVASLIAAELVSNMMRLPSAQKLQRRLCARFRVPPQTCRTGASWALSCNAAGPCLVMPLVALLAFQGRLRVLQLCVHSTGVSDAICSGLFALNA